MLLRDTDVFVKEPPGSMATVMCCGGSPPNIATVGHGVALVGDHVD